MRVERPIPAMLDGILQRTQRLRPQTILASIPEQPGTVRRADDRHGAAVRGADAVRERRAILKELIGQVTGSAGDFAVDAEARVEEQFVTERRGFGVIGI